MRNDMEIRRFLLTVFTLSLIVLAIVVWIMPVNADFRTENPYWNGTRELATSLEAIPLPVLDNVSFQAGDILWLFPYRRYTDSELAIIKNMLDRGGTLVVTSDFGYANQVLEYLKLTSRFASAPLLDPLLCATNRYFPRSVNIIQDPLTAGVDSLVLNHATALEAGAASQVLAWSSAFSFLDSNANGVLDTAEPQGPFPVLAREKAGAGYVILASDSDLFINSMAPQGSNLRLAQNIAALADHRLYIDQAHLPTSNLLEAKGWLDRLYSAIQAPAGTLILIVLVISLMLILIWPAKPMSGPGKVK
jgi:hypothetical protein